MSLERFQYIMSWRSKEYIFVTGSKRQQRIYLEAVPTVLGMLCHFRTRDIPTLQNVPFIPRMKKLMMLSLQSEEILLVQRQ
jgi:hypothetical protein